MKQKSYPQHKTTNYSTLENGFLCEACGRRVTPEGVGLPEEKFDSGCKALILEIAKNTHKMGIFCFAKKS